jgi:hypothetical protein
MEIIRNLSGVQKGLLAGLALGIMAVYFCLCLSAVGIIPVSLPALSGPVAQAATETSVPPTATAMSNITIEEASPTALSETEDAATETSVPTLEVVETAVIAEVATTIEPETSPEAVASEPESETSMDALVALKIDTPVSVEVTDTAEAGAKVASTSPEELTEMAGSDTVALSPDEASEQPVSAATSIIVLLPTPMPAATLEPAASPVSVLAMDSTAPAATPEWIWQGVEVERLPGSKTGTQMAVLAVRVFGVPDREVYVREASSGLATTLVTGRKPQYGDFSDDVGGLPAATYVVSPQDIDAVMEVTLEEGDFVLVEFALRPPSGWSPEPSPEMTGVSVTQGTPVVQKTATVARTEMARASVVLRRPDPTDIPAQPTSTPVPSGIVADPAATLSAKAGWTWQGVVYEQKKSAGDPVGIIAVRIVDVPDRKVFVKSQSNTWETTLVTGRKPEYGDFSDDVGGLGPGKYTILPMDIDSEVTVTLERGDSVLVEYALRPVPGWTPGSATSVPTAQVTAAAQAVQPAESTSAPVPSGIVADPAATESAKAGWTWQGVEYERQPGAETGNAAGVLAVRVVGVPDRKVFVRELSGGWETTLLTGNKPEYGDFSDSVGSLSPGTYVVKPMDVDAEVSVNLETGDFVLLEFALRPAPGWTPDSATAVPVAQETPVAQSTQPAQPTQVSVPVVPTLETGWTWQGVEYERKSVTEAGDAAGVLAVRVVGVPDRKVFVRELSGGWETTLVTGNKPEYGDFSDSVGSLSAGTYIVKPMDIESEVSVDLGTGEFVLVEFALRPAPGWTPGQTEVAQGMPTATLVPGWTWEGREVDRKPGVQTGNASATLVVRGIALPNWQVVIRDVSGVWTMPLQLERHPEYGNFAGVGEGLNPGTYTVELGGDIGPPARVTIEQGDFVLLEFFPRPAQ